VKRGIRESKAYRDVTFFGEFLPRSFWGEGYRKEVIDRFDPMQGKKAYP
jgi:hypothetical protein